MARRRQTFVTPTRLLVAMLAFSTFCLVMPSDWADRLKGLIQPLIPLQAVVYQSVGSVAPASVEGVREAHEGPAQSPSSLEGRLLVLGDELCRLREDYAALAGLRRYIPRRLGRLLPAEVISTDSLAYRSALVISRGQFGGAVKGQWVTSAVWLDRGDYDGLKPDLNVLCSEGLIGRICWVWPYMARVRLLTDPASKIKVRIARVDSAQVRYLKGSWILEGNGPQSMLIRQVDYRLAASGQIRQGDLAVSVVGPDLPIPLRVGRVVSVERSDKTPVVCTVRLRPIVRLESLRRVFVFDPSPVE